MLFSSKRCILSHFTFHVLCVANRYGEGYMRFFVEKIAKSDKEATRLLKHIKR